MPRNNAFRHQSYSAEIPAAAWHLIRPAAPPEPGSAAYEPLMSSAGEAYRAAGVRAIYLVHGTFAGDDPLGLTRVVERVAPGSARCLRQLNKQVFDKLAKDSGNYTAEYAAEFQRSCGVPVERVDWSSENHHIARAHAAVCLIERLVDAGWDAEDRVLMWGHWRYTRG